MKVLVVCFSIVYVLVGCMPTKYAYKVTFTNGSVEYFELDYKPKQNATSITYENDVIIGVKKIERIDK